MNICTIIAKNYVAHARVLAESFKEHHPEGNCYVLVIDEAEGYIDAASEPFELVNPAEIGIDDYEHMAAIYDVLEFSTAVKPWLLTYLLEERGLESIAYFDPDIRIYDRLDEIEELTHEHELVLIPHITDPLPRDGKKPTEADILISGTYNLGFISLKRGARAKRLLDWWAERLKTDCVVAPDVGYFVDQRWMDFVHGVMPGFYVLRDPAYNVAYWNLHGRNLTYERDRRYRVDGQPLRFFHFSGFDPEHRKRLSKHQSRHEIRRRTPLAHLCNEYADALLANGYAEVKDWPYSYGMLPNGIKLDSGMHRLYRKGENEGAPQRSIFSSEGAEEFVAWLNEPAPVGGDHGVTRYLYEIYSGRPDLRQAFPNLDGPDAMRLIEWSRIHGQVALPFPTHPSVVATEHPEGDGYAEGDGAPGRATGVNVAGYFRSELGVGESARQMVAALESQDIPTATVGLVAQLSRQGHEYETDAEAPSYPTNLICVNADMLPTFADQVGPRFFVDRYSIGLWWWETSEFPERFRRAFNHLDEIWVGSHFVADAIAPVSPVPVVKVTMPVSLPEIEPFDREHLGLPDNFVFMFVFDYHSVFERKNPLALIEAFEKAFPAGSGASLVLKSINSEHHADDHERLLEAAEDNPDIHVTDRYVTAAEKNAMFAACDCYVSLHRSEGLGNTLAEAMYLGKPVVATGYSGNMEFMTPQNSYLVDYSLRPVGEGAGPYPPTGEWAEPDVEHAATLMRHVFEHQEEARERGRRAAKDIHRNHSLENAGKTIADRLGRIEARLRSREEEERRHVHRLTGIDTNPLTYRIATTPEPAPSTSLLGRFFAPVRRVFLKLLWPFAMQQRIVNQELLATIREADENLRVVINGIESRHVKDRSDILGAVSRLGERLDKLEARPLGDPARGKRIEELEAKSSKAQADVAGTLNWHSERLAELEAHLVEGPTALPAIPATPDERTAELESLVHEMESLPPEKPPGNGSLSRQAISRLAFPFARQQTVNEQLFTAVRLLSENMRELHRASLKRHMALGQQSVAAEQLLAENRSLPYMAGSPFMLYMDAVNGRVQGYFKQGESSEATGVYHAFEDVFRGPEKLIRDRQRRYLDILGGRSPVLDVGCGRGEFLDLMREQRLEYTGVDLDPEMVEYCRSKGHKRVEQADANSYLEGCPDGSIGVIFCAQVIEHLPYEELLRFFELGRQKLEPGGLFIAETVNPHSVRALKAFWVDPTHQHPIFPEVALALSKIEGFESAYVFHPNGTGDIEADRFETGEYAVVATKATHE